MGMAHKLPLPDVYETVCMSELRCGAHPPKCVTHVGDMVVNLELDSLHPQGVEGKWKSDLTAFTAGLIEARAWRVLLGVPLGRYDRFESKLFNNVSG